MPFKVTERLHCFHRPFVTTWRVRGQVDSGDTGGYKVSGIHKFPDPTP